MLSRCLARCVDHRFKSCFAYAVFGGRFCLFLLKRDQVKLWRLHLRFDSAFEGDVFMFRLHVK